LVHRDLVAVDIAGFGDPTRDDLIRLHMRAGLYGILVQAFEESGIGWHDCTHEDRGDGALIVISPQVPTAALAGPLADRIRAGLRRHNHLSCRAATIQLRMAIHSGYVQHDAHGVAGVAAVHLFRLLEAGQLKKALATSGAELALIVSGYVYDSVIRHDPGLNGLASYQPIEVEVKQTRARAWVHVTDTPGTPGLQPATAIRPITAAREAPAAASTPEAAAGRAQTA